MNRRARPPLSRLRPRDVVEAAAVLVVTCRVELSLRRRGLPATAARFGVELAGPDAPDAAVRTERLPNWAVRRARLAEMLLRWWPYGDTCLRKSLVIGNRLRSLQPRLFVGVRSSPTDGSVLAHAWLEICGIDIDPTSGDYLAFDFT